jgi:hypothetical protein
MHSYKRTTVVVPLDNQAMTPMCRCQAQDNYFCYANRHGAVGMPRGASHMRRTVTLLTTGDESQPSGDGPRISSRNRTRTPKKWLYFVQRCRLNGTLRGDKWPGNTMRVAWPWQICRSHPRIVFDLRKSQIFHSFIHRYYYGRVI